MKEDSISRIKLFYRPPNWATGYISDDDAVFLHRLVGEICPETVIEIGVASGCSSAVILNAMDGVGLGMLYSFDIDTHCYFDRSRPIGAAVAEMGGQSLERWILKCGTSVEAGEMLRGHDVAMAFVDANHSHPWPTIDVAALLPAMKPDGWVVLHDISLPNLNPERSHVPHGAQYLYEAWPGEKKSSGGLQNNIGAIQLLGDHQRSVAALRDVLEVQWETEVSDRICSTVLGGWAPKWMSQSLVDVVRREQAEGRPIVIWGAGGAGRVCLAELFRAGIGVRAFVDSSPSKMGESVEGISVVSPSYLEKEAASKRRSFVVIASMFHAEIGSALRGLGYRADRDYIVAAKCLSKPESEWSACLPKEPMTGTCVVSPETLGPFTNGGVGTAAYRLSQLLARAGFPVTFLYTGKVVNRDRSEWQKRYYDDVGIQIVVLEDWTDPTPKTDSEEAFPDALDSIRAQRTHEFLSQQNFQVIYFQEFMGHGLRAIQAWRAGVSYCGARLVTWCHSSLLWSMLGNDRHVTSLNELMIEAHERIATRLCRVVVSPSRYMTEWVRSNWSISEVQDLPYWFVPGGNQVDEQETFTHTGFSHLVFFGRLERRKGLDYLLGALRTSSVLRGLIRKVSFLGRQIEIDGRRSGEYISDALKDTGVSWEIVDGLGTDDALDWLDRQKDVLVVAPSVLDNFPFAVMELMAKRIPFLSTDVGGIPEVVGAANEKELLMEASVSGVRRRLEEVFSGQSLHVDYRAGYSPVSAEEEVLTFHRRQLSLAKVEVCDVKRGSHPIEVWVVYNGLVDDVARSLESLVACSSGRRCMVRILFPSNTSDWERVQLEQRLTEGSDRGWWRNGGAVFVDEMERCAQIDESLILLLRAGEVLEFEAIDRMDTALELSGAACVCGYVRRLLNSSTPDRFVEHRPLGGALELGFLDELSVTTPLLVSPAFRGMLVKHFTESRGSLQVVLQSFACEVCLDCGGEERLGVIPLRVAKGPPLPVLSQRDRSLLGRIHQTHRARLNSELLFPLVYSRIRNPNSVRTSFAQSRAMGCYACLAGVDEDLLTSFLQRQVRDDAISHIGQRIGPLLSDWMEDPPRLFVYGAGEHSKVLLGLYPILWKWIVAFVDGRRREPFLGKPCFTPDAVDFGVDATVLYSSREYQEEMYERMKCSRVNHVRIYPAKS